MCADACISEGGTEEKKEEEKQVELEGGRHRKRSGEVTTLDKPLCRCQGLMVWMLCGNHAALSVSSPNTVEDKIVQYSSGNLNANFIPMRHLAFKKKKKKISQDDKIKIKCWVNKKKLPIDEF